VEPFAARVSLEECGRRPFGTRVIPLEEGVMVVGESHDGPTPDESGFRIWAAGRMTTLRRRAYLLCGDWHAADDLVQESLASMYKSWSRIAAGNNVDAYAARVLLHKFLDERRRPWRRESVVETLPERVDESSARALAAVDGRDDSLLRALRSLPAGQRAVVVLRYDDDLSLEQISRVLELRVGTVKSRLSRATEALRRALADAHATQPVSVAATEREPWSQT
jgi:RNA polymerase sigma-70 factor (sigma-E family)